MDKQVIIYTTPSCQYCKAVKGFFEENNVEFEEYDVQANIEKRQEMVEKSGQMGVPVIFIGEEMVIGFDKDRLSELLKIK